MMKTYIRMLCVLLVLALTVSLAACAGGAGQENTTATTTGPAAEPTAEPTTKPAESAPVSDITVANPVSYFTVNIYFADGSYKTLNAYDDGMGGVYAEYVGEEKKVATFDPSLLHAIAAKLEESGLPALNDTHAYADGADSASMYITFADDSMLAADYSGVIAQEFLDGYAVMEAYFKELMADVPVYVPQPMVMGQVNADALAAMQEILASSGIQGLDGLVISDVPKDEFFNHTMGLSSDAGIASGTSCTAMMMTTAYSFVIVMLEDGASADAVCKDFEENLGWRKWVCVAPRNALIAVKDNMVLCLMGSDTMYTGTAAAAKASGWTEIAALENPNL